MKRHIFIIALLCMLALGADAQTNTTVPDSLPVVTPYYLQHQYLSILAPMVSEDGAEVFATLDILNSISSRGNGFISPFNDSDIKVERLIVDNKKVYVWQFPEPEYLREALYMVFLPIDGYYKAYAFCIGQLVDWEISSSTSTYRQTFGRVKRPDSASECVDILKERGAFTNEQIVPGKFIQDEYSSPKYRPTPTGDASIMEWRYLSRP